MNAIHLQPEGKIHQLRPSFGFNMLLQQLIELCNIFTYNLVQYALKKSSFLFQLLPQSSKARFYFPLGFVDIFLFVLHTLNHYVPIGICLFLSYTLNNQVPIGIYFFLYHTNEIYERILLQCIITFVVIPTLIWHINHRNLHINIGTKYCNILALFILCWKLSMTHCIRNVLLWTNQQRLPVIKEGT